MAVDVEKIEENRLKFLAALHEIASEHLEKNEVPGGIVCIGEGMWVIGERAGLTRQETDRVSTDLLKTGLVIVQSAIDAKGPSFTLTSEGCQAAEDYIYEKSSLGKRRMIGGILKEKAVAVLVAAFGKLGSWIGGILIGAFGATYGTPLLRWIKSLFGMN
jgi:hypothetical protein